MNTNNANPRDNINQIITTQWFANHIATYADLRPEPLKILVWRNPKTSTYYCRYVFDACYLYISGDIGEAVFCFSEMIDINSFDSMHVDYFYGKLKAYDRSESPVDFDGDQAVARLQEWKTELVADEKLGGDEDGDEDKDNMEKMDRLIQIAQGCTTPQEWHQTVNDDGGECGDGGWNDFISKLDQDYWEWIYKIGNCIPWRIYGYWIGLRMAAQQVREREEKQREAMKGIMESGEAKAS